LIEGSFFLKKASIWFLVEESFLLENLILHKVTYPVTSLWRQGLCSAATFLQTRFVIQAADYPDK
jgi:hypothetical protein